MENDLAPFGKSQHAIAISNVGLVKLRTRRNISYFAADQRIAADYLMTFPQKMLCEVTTQKSSDTSDEYFHYLREIAPEERQASSLASKDR